MKFSYSSSNLRIIDLLQALFLSKEKSKKRIINYFKMITEKEYIIITNSCRSALYLAYKAIEKKGEVISSPLTCKVAIDPVIESENKIVFADINSSDLNINTDDIAHRINKNTIAIQAIHLGGNSCEMNKINQIAKKNRLWVIEDCAQSLGARYKNKYTGSHSDIACFSLIKNAYGIGGGILATDSPLIYKKVSMLINGQPKAPIKLIMFRIVRNIIDTKRKYKLGRFLYKVLMQLKGNNSSYKTINGQLFEVSSIEKKIAAHQIIRFKKLHQARKLLGTEYFQRLVGNGILYNKGYIVENSSFTKYYVYNPKINSKLNLETLHDSGIEAMHLEHKYLSPYQERMVTKIQASKTGLINYNKVHDSIISLPLVESFNEQDLAEICNSLNFILASKDI